MALIYIYKLSISVLFTLAISAIGKEQQQAMCYFLGILASPWIYIFDDLTNLNYYISRWTCVLLFPLLGIKIEITDDHGAFDNEKSNNDPRILIMNHQSSLDAFILAALCQKKSVVIMKKSIFLYPVVGLFLFLGRNIFVDRFNRDKAVKTFKSAADRINQEKLTVMMFPEGTRSHFGDADLLPFKKGAFHLAVQSKAPVIPVVVSFYQPIYNGKKLQFQGGNIKIKTLPAQSVNSEYLNDSIELIREKMLTCLKEISK